jgi:exodeoxyribonuclease VII small subunit
MSEKPLTFEEALARLETIVQQIERGQIGLEQSITRYEEGMTLVRQCIHQHADGTVELTEFAAPVAKEDSEKRE